MKIRFRGLLSAFGSLYSFAFFMPATKNTRYEYQYEFVKYLFLEK